MKYTLSFVLLFCFTNKILAQEYFQQEVNYDIEVTLDDKNHVLTGVAKIEYINHSPDVLDKIYFHLWANAYRNYNTPFAKQQLQQKSTDFFFADEDELGGYTYVNFEGENGNSAWNFDPGEKGQEVVEFKLAKSLSPGARVDIRIPFTINIPKYFSRMGHVEQAYYLCQWYPKPAVYDQAGWHTMPYLDQGEFYSEFGSFDVKITVPKNYVVAATGTLQTESEKVFLEKKIKETNAFLKEKGIGEEGYIFGKDTFPTSAAETKTLRFTAEEVHDFAWFADKRFLVQKSEVQLASGKQVDTWAFFNFNEAHLWKKATNYLNRSVKFYSEKVGEYPYPHVSAVNNPFASAGAMEYPMITLVDQMFDAESLDIVITHEVGHNWFYGILGFNERDHNWMDEGINSYYEKRYVQKYYPADEEEELTMEEAMFTHKCRRHTAQKPSLNSIEFTSTNYWLSVYEKPAKAFQLLEKYLGTEKFDAIQQDFYNQWKFKHPQPADLQNHVEKNSGKKLSWLFDGLIGSTKNVDYSFVNISKSDSYELEIKNKGTLGVPFAVSGMKEGKVISVQWFEGFEGTKNINFPQGDFDKFIIDQERITTDLNRKNNSISTKGAFKKIEPLRLKLFSGMENPERSTMYWLPVAAWNNYDKTMVGAVIHNIDFPLPTFEYLAMPMYALASKELVGNAHLKYNIFPNSNLFKRITIGVNGKRYNYNYDWTYLQYENYYKIAPRLEFEFAEKSLLSNKKHTLSFRHVNITQNNIRGIDFQTGEFAREQNNYFVNEAKYIFLDENATAPRIVEAAVHQGDGFLKIFTAAKQSIVYQKKNKGLTLKAFAGVFAQYDNPSAPVAFLRSGTTGFAQRDYMFDQILLGRSENSGIFSQQIFHRDGALKTLNFGGSADNWMFSFGARTTLPGPLPIQPYADAVIRNYSINSGTEIISETAFDYSLGLAVVAIPDALEIYFPLLENDAITNGYTTQGRGTFFKKVSFVIDLHKILEVGKQIYFF